MRVLESFRENPALMNRWGKAYLDLQVLLALVDGVLSPDERALLTIVTQQAFSDPLEGQIRVARLADSIIEEGFEAACPSVLMRISSLLRQLPEEQQHATVARMLEDVLAMVVANGRVQPATREFVLERLGPALKVEERFIIDLLGQAERVAEQHRVYTESAFEIYLLLNDADTSAPPLSLDEVEAQGQLPRAICAMMLKHNLRSPLAVGYLLTSVGGMTTRDQYECHLDRMEELVVTQRALRELRGTRARMEAIREALERLVREGVDPDAFGRVKGHVTAILGSMDSLNNAARRLLREEIAPALGINMEELIAAAEAVKHINGMLFRNITGSDIPVREDRGWRWTDFWTNPK